ncbi:SphA family protein [Novosphingobium naphthalenivorans]|uniref:SphA family protein n=1 Tax=Novosphingobium naphthalenivorans TaxID=273168 RepID=UPI000834ED88|nr:transporter [Novosphingobium naphthalenivorans]
MKLLCRLLLAACVIPAASPALAREAGVPSSVPPGSTMGVAVGANPPPGVYIGTRSGFWEARLKGDDGKDGGQDNTLVDTAVQLMVVPRAEILGASYRAFVTVPVMYNAQDRRAPFPEVLQGSEHKLGLGNIEISPVNLSWQVEPGVFVSTGLSIFAPTSGFDVSEAINTGGDFWTFTPSIGASYLRDGWNLSAGLAYFMNTRSGETDYRSGNEFMLNATAFKDMGGWSLGPVGYWRKQVTSDDNNGMAYGGTTQGKAEQAAVGLGFTRRFGTIEANLNVTQQVYTRNAVDGTKVWLNILVPLGH